DRQPEAGRGLAAGGPRGAALEAAEEPGLVVFGETRPLVPDLEPHRPVGLLDVDPDRAPRRRVLDRVADEVLEDVAQPLLVAFDQAGPVGRRMDALLLGLGLRLQGPRDGEGEGAHVHRLAMDREPAALDRVALEQAVHDVEHALGRARGVARVLRRRRGRGPAGRRPPGPLEGWGGGLGAWAPVRGPFALRAADPRR